MNPPGSASYRRAQGCVFRWVRGSVLVVAPGRGCQKLIGTAALVWMTLDSPGTLEQAEERLVAIWPDLEVTEPAYMHDALVLLLDAELVEAVVGGSASAW